MALPPSSKPNSLSTAAATTNTTTTATTPRLFSNPPHSQPPVTKTPIHHHFAAATYPSHRQHPVHHHHHHHNYPNIAPRGVPHLFKPHDPPPPPPPQPAAAAALPRIPYQLASTCRGFLPKPITATDHPVPMANPGAFPPHPYTPNPARVPYGCQPMQLIRQTHLQQPHNLRGSTGGLVKGIPIPSLAKVVCSPALVTDCNGYKDTRDRIRDDNFVTVRDRKVRVSDGASLYAQCRSWLRNGFPEERQPQYVDGVKSLPRPLPLPVADAHSPKKTEGDNEAEDEGDIKQLSQKELLQRHIKRAKKVRARLREERLQRIARYKTRLALLLPPIVEQQLRNDTAAGN